MSRRMPTTSGDGGARRTLSAGGRHNEIKGELWYSPSLQGQRRAMTVSINTTLGKILVAEVPPTGGKPRNVAYESKFLSLTATSWFTHEGGHGRATPYGSALSGKWFYFTVAVQKPDGGDTGVHPPPKRDGKDTPRPSVLNKPRAHTPSGRSALLRHPHTLPSTVVRTPRGCETLVFSTNKPAEKKKWEHFFRNPIKSCAHDGSVAPPASMPQTTALARVPSHSGTDTAHSLPLSSHGEYIPRGHSSPRSIATLVPRVQAAATATATAPFMAAAAHSASAKASMLHDCSNEDMSVLIDVPDVPRKPTSQPRSRPSNSSPDTNRDAGTKTGSPKTNDTDLDAKVRQLLQEREDLESRLHLKGEALKSAEMERLKDARLYKQEIKSLRDQPGNKSGEQVCHRCEEDKTRRNEERKTDLEREKDLRKRLDTLTSNIWDLQAMNHNRKQRASPSLAALIEEEAGMRSFIQTLYMKISTEAFSLMDGMLRLKAESSRHLDRSTRQSSLPTVFGSPQTPSTCSHITDDVLERDILLEAAERRLLLSLEGSHANTPPRRYMPHSPESLPLACDSRDASPNPRPADEWVATSDLLEVHFTLGGEGASEQVLQLRRSERFSVHELHDTGAAVSCALVGTVQETDMLLLQREYSRADTPHWDSMSVRSDKTLAVNVGGHVYMIPAGSRVSLSKYDEDVPRHVSVTIRGDVRAPLADAAAPLFPSGWVVVGAEGATVRTGESLDSRIVIPEPLPCGTAVSVSHVVGSRAHIVAPVTGWVSMTSRATLRNESHQILERACVHRQGWLERAHHEKAVLIKRQQKEIDVEKAHTAQLQGKHAHTEARCNALQQELATAKEEHAEALDDLRGDLEEKAIVADFYLDKICQLECLVMRLKGENAAPSELQRAVASELALHKTHLTDASLVSDSIASVVSTAESTDDERRNRRALNLKSLVEVQKEELRIKSSALERLSASHEELQGQLCGAHDTGDRLQRDLQRLEEAAAASAVCVEGLEADLSQLRGDLQEAEGRLAQAEAQHITDTREAAAEVSSLRSDLAAAEEVSGRLQAEVAEAEAQRQDLAAHSGRVEGELQGDNQSLREEVEGLRTQLSDAQLELQEQVSRAADELQETQKLHGAVDTAECEAARLRSDLSVSEQSRNNLLLELSEAEEQAAALQREAASQQGAQEGVIADLRQRVLRTEDLLHAAEADQLRVAASYEQAASTLSASLAASEKVREDLADTLARAQDNLRSAEEDVRRLGGEASRLDEEAARLEGERRTLQEDFERQSGVVADLTRKVATAAETEATLSSEVDSLRASLAGAECKANTLSSRLNASERVREELADKVSEAAGHVVEEEARHMATAGELRGVKEAMARHEEATENLQAEKTVLALEVNSLRIAVTTAEENAKSLASSLAASERVRTELAQTASQKEADLHDAELKAGNDIKDVERRRAADHKKLQDEQAALVRKSDNLRNALTVAEEQLAVTNANLAASERTREHLVERLAAGAHLKDHLEGDLAHLQDQLMDMREAVECAEAARDDVVREHAACGATQGRVVSLESELHSVTSQKDAAEQHNLHLQDLLQRREFEKQESESRREEEVLCADSTLHNVLRHHIAERDTLVQREQDNARLRKKLRESRDRLEEAEEAAEASKDSSSQLAAELRISHREIATTQQTMKELKEEAAAAREYGDAKADEIAMLQDEHIHLTSKLDAKTQKISHLQEELCAETSRSNDDLHKLSVEVGQLQADLSSSERSVLRLQGANEKLKSEKDHLQEELHRELGDAAKWKKEAQQEHMALEGEIAALRQEVEEKDKEGVTLRTELSSVMSQLSLHAGTHEELSRLRKENTDLHAGQLPLKECLATLRHSEGKREAEAASLQYKVAGLQAELEERDEVERVTHAKVARLEVEATVAAALKEQVVSLEVEKGRLQQKMTEKVSELEGACRTKDDEIMRLEEWAAQQACVQAEDHARIWAETSRITKMQVDVADKVSRERTSKQALVKSVKRVAAAEVGKAKNAERVARECELRAQMAEESEWKVRKEKAVLEEELGKARSRSAGSATVITRSPQSAHSPHSPDSNSPTSAASMRLRAAGLEERWSHKPSVRRDEPLDVALRSALESAAEAAGVPRAEGAAFTLKKRPRSTPTTPRALCEISASAANTKAHSDFRLFRKMSAQYDGPQKQPRTRGRALSSGGGRQEEQPTVEVRDADL
eukprot:TRINITY_DN15789_c0_g1_i3.p1 TRINITY_DN15789_c0_g1~~TRINITY_DN15789_c0_g1_i3.p1  ORF type:complete len:2213 (+),score=747.92 TRINITY_DN15789_c0_g1_i3:48-6686(+)